MGGCVSSSSPRSRYEITTADAAQQPAKVAAWVSKRPECGGAAWAGPGDDGSGFHAPPKPRRFGTGVFHSSDLKTGALLGRGKFAQVKLVEAVKADEATWFAVKEIRKRNIVDKDLVKKVQNEIELLAELHHPFVCHIFGGYQDDAKVSLVVEYLPGGELFNQLRRRQKFPVEEARFYAAEISLALGYLHEVESIVYRDLKPENIMLDEHGHVRFVDFGFAVRLKSKAEQITGGCGTAMYLAPEIAAGHLAGAHGLAVDWFSFGCVLYEMVVGKAPFGDIDVMSKFDIFNRIIAGKVSYPRVVPKPLKLLLQGLLKTDPAQRFRWSDVRASSWFEGIDWDDALNKRLKPPWEPPDLSEVGCHSSFLQWRDRPREKETALNSDECMSCHFSFGCCAGASGGKAARSSLVDKSKTPTKKLTRGLKRGATTIMKTLPTKTRQPLSRAASCRVGPV